MDRVRFQFIWGAGGVGKSHLAIRKCYEAEGQRLLLTLDPSRRLFHLLNLDPDQEAECELNHTSFKLRQTSAFRLFQELEKKLPASERVRHYFRELVGGLQRFRDYLSLIELGDEMKASSFNRIIIDTPPFHEAKHFQHSILNLHEFFDRSLVQLGLRTDWLQMGVRKALDAIKLFTGKKNLEVTLEFLDWLALHLERFQSSAQSLHGLIFHEQTLHTIVITPESSIEDLAQMQDFFGRAARIEFVMNRSVEHFKISENLPHPFNEFSELSVKERALTQQLQKAYPKARFERVALSIMGDDTREELLEFLGSGKVVAEAPESKSLRPDGQHSKRSC
jgi:hypothetical protein